MKTLAVLKYGAALLGAGLLAGGLYWARQNQSLVAEGSRAEGTVVSLIDTGSGSKRKWKPLVRFVAADGRSVEFTTSTSSSPPAYSVGERVRVLYRASSPEEAAIDGFLALWLGPLILGGVGAGFLGIGGGMIVYAKARARLAERLRTQGMPIQAKFQGVELNAGLHVNGRHPYRVVAQWQNPASGEIHVFHSENLWYDPSEHIRRDELTVYIDQADPRKYFVDLSFLPKLAS